MGSAVGTSPRSWVGRARGPGSGTAVVASGVSGAGATIVLGEALGGAGGAAASSASGTSGAAVLMSRFWRRVCTSRGAWSEGLRGGVVHRRGGVAVDGGRSPGPHRGRPSRGSADGTSTSLAVCAGWTWSRISGGGTRGGRAERRAVVVASSTLPLSARGPGTRGAADDNNERPGSFRAVPKLLGAWPRSRHPSRAVRRARPAAPPPTAPLDGVDEPAGAQEGDRPPDEPLERRDRTCGHQVERSSELRARHLLRSSMDGRDGEIELRSDRPQELDLLPRRVQQRDVEVGAQDGDDETGEATTRAHVQDPGGAAREGSLRRRHTPGGGVRGAPAGALGHQVVRGCFDRRHEVFELRVLDVGRWHARGG